MRLTFDEVQHDLSLALRSKLGGSELSGDGSFVRRVLGELDLFGLELPAEAGGLELGLGKGAVVCEELGRLAASDGYRDGTLLADLLTEQVATVGIDLLPEIAAGDVSTATAGWDAPIRIHRHAGTPTLTGRCRLVGPVDADFFVVPARDEREQVIATVAADTPGVGVVAGRLTELRFEGAAAHTLSEAVDAAGHPGPALVRARIRQAAYLLGLAAGAHRLAVVQATRRRQFDQVIGANQAVVFPLAKQLAEAEAVRLLVHRAAWLNDQEAGQKADDSGAAHLAAPHLSSTPLAGTQALAYAAELALDTTAWAVHVHGASGLTRQAPVHRYYELAAIEAVRWGRPEALWREAARLRDLRARRDV